MGQIKTTGILIALILMLVIVFQSYRLKVSNEKQKALQTQINAISKQNENNLSDLSKRNEEVKQANEKINIFQKQIDKIRQSNSDKCFNSYLPDDVLQLLINNGIK